jgi:isoleucyl-tRNA synthetase
VTFAEEVSSYTSYSFKPQLRTLGPKYGKQLGGIRAFLSNIDGLSAMAAAASFKEGGTLDFEVDGVRISLGEEDLLIEMSQKEGFVAQADKAVTVVLDTNLTPELLEEGFSAEVISKIQTMRKEAGFEVMDHIDVSVTGNEKIASIVQKNVVAISEKVLADGICYKEELAGAKEWKVNGETVVIGVRKR